MMFRRIRERKINKLVTAAEAFIGANYEESKPDEAKKAQFSRRLVFTEADIRDCEIEYSRKPDKGPGPAAGTEKKPVQYSISPAGDDSGLTIAELLEKMRDNYNAGTVGFAVKSLSYSGSETAARRTLEKSTDMSFADKMYCYMGKRGMISSDVYKAANIDRRLFSKITTDRSYKPSKDTCIALSLAMHLTLAEASDLLSRAGYVLSHSSKRDVVIEYFFRESIYSMIDVNEILYRLGEKTIGE